MLTREQAWDLLLGNLALNKPKKTEKGIKIIAKNRYIYIQGGGLFIYLFLPVRFSPHKFCSSQYIYDIKNGLFLFWPVLVNVNLNFLAWYVLWRETTLSALSHPVFQIRIFYPAYLEPTLLEPYRAERQEKTQRAYGVILKMIITNKFKISHISQNSSLFWLEFTRSYKTNLVTAGVTLNSNVCE